MKISVVSERHLHQESLIVDLHMFSGTCSAGLTIIYNEDI